MQTILITGGAGFIGRHIVKELISKNCKVIIIDNFSNCNDIFATNLRKQSSPRENLRVYKQDIRDSEAMSKVFGSEKVDACIHLAAKIGVEDSMSQPLETISVNVLGTLNILQACSQYNINNFVFASSAAVYGEPKRLPIRETHLPQPNSPYGASKLAAEALVSSFRKSTNNYKILRFFNVYGKGQTSAYAGVISKFISRLSNNLPPVINGKGDQTRDFISVNDVVRAILLAVEKRYDGFPINIGTGRQTSIKELAYMLIELFHLKGRIRPIYQAPIPGDVVHSFGDVKRAHRILKFSAADYMSSRSIREHLLQDYGVNLS
jgi:UDP-glucose 4-epimerase